jgi:hypothetical protein
VLSVNGERWARDTFDYVVVLTELQPERAKIAAFRWHGRARARIVDAQPRRVTARGLAALADL